MNCCKHCIVWKYFPHERVKYLKQFCSMVHVLKHLEVEGRLFWGPACVGLGSASLHYCMHWIRYRLSLCETWSTRIFGRLLHEGYEVLQLKRCCLRYHYSISRERQCSSLPKRTNLRNSWCLVIISLWQHQFWPNALALGYVNGDNEYGYLNIILNNSPLELIRPGRDWN